MHRRTIYSQGDPTYPIVEILWHPKEIAAGVKDGTLDINAVGALFNKVLTEIKDTIVKAKGDGTAK